jgi:hypothetical protein
MAMNNKGLGGQTMTIMTLLDLVPGHADDPDNGEAIGIMTVDHQAQIESFVVTLRDARTLIQRLVGMLAHHGCPVAEEMSQSYFFGGKCPFPLLPNERVAPLPPKAVTSSGSNCH